MKKSLAFLIGAVLLSGMTCRLDPAGIQSWARDIRTVSEGVTKYTLIEHPEKREELVKIRDKIRFNSGTISFGAIAQELLPLAKNLKESDAVLIAMGAQLVFDRIGAQVEGIPNIQPLAEAAADGMTAALK